MIKILVCDDHHLIAEGIATMLQDEEGLEVVGMTFSGKDAIDFLHKNKDVDLLILDISMPKMDGVEVLKELCKWQLEVSVLMLTMHENLKYIKEVERLGAQGYILKSSEISQLVTAIRKIGSGEMYYDPKVAELLMRELRHEENQRKKRGKLTKRENEILQMLVKGMKVREISDVLYISDNTILTHKKNIYEKIGVHSISELINYAYQNGLVERDES